MNLQQRIDLLTELGTYCQSADTALENAKRRANTDNRWFTPEFIDIAVNTIATRFLQKDKLTQWAASYNVQSVPARPNNVGLVMAGNIPLVGFHDFLAVFLSGHNQTIKPSSKDEALIRHLVSHLLALDPAVSNYLAFAERLNGCDAYIATGSNNSARYFDYYFSRYPHIIRRNRTSAAILNGGETTTELEALADDIHQYFGLGCRNVTKIFVPEGYDFVPLLDALKKYEYLADFAKYKHNYDYQLTLLILNKKYYMTNGSTLLSEVESPFSPISVLHYEYYKVGEVPSALLAADENIQCIVGQGLTPFGHAQQPELTDYADGVDTMEFLKNL